MGQTLGQRLSPDHRVRLGQLVRKLRIEAGLRQEDLAPRMGASQNAVWNLEIGQRRLDVLELRLLCAALGFPVEAFIDQLEGALSNQA